MTTRPRASTSIRGADVDSELRQVSGELDDRGREAFLSEVLAGLSATPKRISPKWLYDERGSHLFDRITELEEYYPTRIETGILSRNVDEIAGALGEGSVLIEYGSGSSSKTRILLDRLRRLAAYVPIDISRDHLLKSAEALRAEYPSLPVVPVVADYTESYELPPEVDHGAHRVVFFPGSTIGNFHPVEARRFLEGVARVCDHDGGLLIGFDLKKDPAVIHGAYNDAQGVTAEFNLNLMRRMNRELGADFDTGAFLPYAFYNPREGRVEMHLVSMRAQDVRIAGRTFSFAEGESLWTESSYKFSQVEFEALASEAGFDVVRTWTDPARLFAVMYLEAL